MYLSHQTHKGDNILVDWIIEAIDFLHRSRVTDVTDDVREVTDFSRTLTKPLQSFLLASHVKITNHEEIITSF